MPVVLLYGGKCTHLIKAISMSSLISLCLISHNTHEPWILKAIFNMSGSETPDRDRSMMLPNRGHWV